MPSAFAIDGSTIAVYYMDGTAGSAAKIDNAQGTAALDLVETGSPSAVTGYTGTTANGAYTCFSGGNYITVPDNAAIELSTLTMEMWFKTTNLSTGFFHRYVNGTDRVFRIYLDGAGQIDGFFYDTTNTNSSAFGGAGTPAVSDGNFHYLAITVDGSNIKLYVDPTSSTPNKTTAFAQTLQITANAPLDIGKGNPVETGNPTLTVDSFRISSGARSGTDIYNYFAGIDPTKVALQSSNRFVSVSRRIIAI